MRALQDMPISFPGLFGDWSFNPDPIAVHIGHGIYWYGIILAIGLLAGLVLCMKQAKRYGLTEDNVLALYSTYGTKVVILILFNKSCPILKLKIVSL